MTLEQAERFWGEWCLGGDGHATTNPHHMVRKRECRTCLLDALTASPGMAACVDCGVSIHDHRYDPETKTALCPAGPEAKCLGCGLPVRECLCRQWTGDSPTLAAPPSEAEQEIDIVTLLGGAAIVSPAPPSEKERTCERCGGQGTHGWTNAQTRETSVHPCHYCNGTGKRPRAPGGGEAA